MMGTRNTANGLVGNAVGNKERSHEASFDKILPSAMDKLIADGLFEPDGNGSYKITELGKAHLKSLTAK